MAAFDLPTRLTPSLLDRLIDQEMDAGMLAATTTAR